MQQYHYPLEDGFTERIHTPGGVRSLVEGSHLMKLLRDLDKDGFNVDGPLAELTALINYVTSSQMSMRDLQTHLDYCAEQLRKQTRSGLHLPIGVLLFTFALNLQRTPLVPY